MSIKIKAAMELSGLSALSIEEGSGTILWPEGAKKPTDEELNAKIKELELEDKKESIGVALINLVDAKQEEIGKQLLGFKWSPMQLERYKDRYERALSGEVNPRNTKIITDYEGIRDKIREVVDFFEEYRIEVEKIITAGDLEKAEKAVLKGWELTPQDKIKKVLKEL